ncbi:MAG: response regulator, partial [Gammaproteobacteria bacterium]|nr:response regulator [Gammaproteobacteria bacterium]
MGAESLAPTVLLVDDDDLDRFLVRLVLDAAGYRVLEAPTAEAALDLMGIAGHPDALIIDYVMPGMDGAEFCRKIRTLAALQHVPIVMRTGLEDPRIDALALEAGANRLLAKSGDPSP